jgi:hypothetical protein
MLKAEPTDARDTKQPADPIDRNEPAEPMLNTEPAEPMDRMDPVEPIDRIEPRDPSDQRLGSCLSVISPVLALTRLHGNRSYGEVIVRTRTATIAHHWESRLMRSWS